MTELPPAPAPWFTADHRACDTTWAEVESAIDSGDIPAAAAAWTRFDASMRRHLAMEEEVLFPALEAAGMPRMGPIHVMLMEHQQMKSVLDTMGSCAEAADWEGVADHGDTLLMLIQQHNVKEEAVLYPMANQMLSHRWAELAEQLSRY
jgi:hemerythrin-like domain-containing protein